MEYFQAFTVIEMNDIATDHFLHLLLQSESFKRAIPITKIFWNPEHVAYWLSGSDGTCWARAPVMWCEVTQSALDQLHDSDDSFCWFCDTRSSLACFFSLNETTNGKINNIVLFKCLVFSQILKTAFYFDMNIVFVFLGDF